MCECWVCGIRLLSLEVNLNYCCLCCCCCLYCLPQYATVVFLYLYKHTEQGSACAGLFRIWAPLFCTVMLWNIPNQHQVSFISLPGTSFYRTQTNNTEQPVYFWGESKKIIHRLKMTSQNYRWLKWHLMDLVEYWIRFILPLVLGYLLQ